MLVIISDIHLTDGTSGETIRTGAFRAFRERLRDLAYDASWRPDPNLPRGRYVPVEELHLVLLGDILDVIRSSKWCDALAAVRPWGATGDPRFVRTVEEITGDILRVNKESLDVLRSMSVGGLISVPPPTPEGDVMTVSRDPKSAERRPVKVQIHYLVGNHDWFYHLPGPEYDSIRRTVVEDMGLANPANVPFPHDPAESAVVSKLYQEHRVFARHGDIYDQLNFESDRNASSFGDAMVIELLNRFPQTVRQKMGQELSDECKNGLKELDNVRPLEIIPVWIDGLLRRTCTEEQGERIKQTWNQMAEDFLGLDFVQSRTPLPLRWGLKLSRGFSLSTLSRLVLRLKARFLKEERFYPNAFREPAFKNQISRFVVYGHTHHHEIVPLQSTPVSGGLCNQVYINSGTWRAVHELAQLHPDREEFISYHVMTYLAFFKDGERKGRAFESWSGALDSSAI